MMKNVFVLLILLSTLSSFGKIQPKPVFTIEHTPCYGSCPNYTMSIYANGFVEYDGGHFANLKGKYHKVIKKREVNTLIKQFRKAKFFAFQDEYTATVTDLPTTYITFTDRGKTKKITDYWDAPASLRKLEVAIDAIANSEGWVCDEKKEILPQK